MSWTKLDFIKQAFSELGLASYIYDLSPEQLQDVSIKFDSMLATWNAVGIRLGVPMPSSPGNSDISVDTSIPDFANDAVVLNLALRIAPSYGKIASQDTRLLAKKAYDIIFLRTVKIPQMQFPSTLPLGAGNKAGQRTNRQFVDPPVDLLDAGGDGQIDFE